MRHVSGEFSRSQSVRIVLSRANSSGFNFMKSFLLNLGISLFLLVSAALSDDTLAGVPRIIGESPGDPGEVPYHNPSDVIFRPMPAFLLKKTKVDDVCSALTKLSKKQDPKKRGLKIYIRKTKSHTGAVPINFKLPAGLQLITVIQMLAHEADCMVDFSRIGKVELIPISRESE
ncbi:MAG: hypothetical protein V4710_01330 [Verrucomicrobiota bacterium]